MKKLNNSQWKAIADILEKIGLGSGLAIFINAIILGKDTSLSIGEIIAITTLSLTFLVLSILWRR